MSQAHSEAQLAHVPLNAIQLSHSAAQSARRKHFNAGELTELANSIVSQGVLQPIIVRRADGGMYELVAGERRYLASERAGLDQIPCVVRTLTDEQVLEVQLIENLQRADLHPMQEAEGYQELMKKHSHPIEELHTRVGKSRSYVYGRLKLLALCKEARAAFYDGKIAASVALLIARISPEQTQKEALKALLQDRWGDGPMSYREAAELVQEEYMLRLERAPFPTGDGELVKGTPACGKCPKNTLAQPELFGDVKASRAGVCTDIVCFKSKRTAWSTRLVQEAKAKGQTLITGKAAKEVAPYGPDSLREGYARPTDRCPSDAKARTWAQLLGKEAHIEILQLPKTGEVIEVINGTKATTQLRKLGKLPKVKPAPSTGSSAKVNATRERDRAYKRALFNAAIASAPKTFERWMIAALMEREINMGDVEPELIAEVCDRDLGLTRGTMRDGKIAALLANVSELELSRLAIVVLVGPDLEYGTPKAIETLAKRLGVDTKKARAAAAIALKADKAKKGKAA